MTDKTAQPEQTPAEAPPEQTLESLYEEYQIAQPGPDPVAAPPTEQPPAGNDTAAIHQELAAFRNELTAERRRKADEREQADLISAVATLGKESELEGKDLILRGYLIAKATDDQRLRALWEKRADNPAAWNKALKIMAGEVKKEFQVPNPQLEENQRAMEESQRATTTSRPPATTRDEEWMRKPDPDFQRDWARLSGRG